MCFICASKFRQRICVPVGRRTGAISGFSRNTDFQIRQPLSRGQRHPPSHTFGVCELAEWLLSNYLSFPFLTVFDSKEADALMTPYLSVVIPAFNEEQRITQ